MFDDFERALGLDEADPREVLAVDLAEADLRLLERLVQLRKERGMSKADVAVAMGRHRSVVTNFEKLSSDPHLSTIRRYAIAIGARITHDAQLDPPAPAAEEPQPSVDEPRPSVDLTGDAAGIARSAAELFWAGATQFYLSASSAIDARGTTTPVVTGAGEAKASTHLVSTVASFNASGVITTGVGG